MPKSKPEGRSLSDALIEMRNVRFDGTTVPCAVYQREKLDVGLTLRGPAILDQFDCTTAICAGQVARVDEWKNLIVTEGEGRCPPPPSILKSSKRASPASCRRCKTRCSVPAFPPSCANRKMHLAR